MIARKCFKNWDDCSCEILSAGKWYKRVLLQSAMTMSPPISIVWLLLLQTDLKMP